MGVALLLMLALAEGLLQVTVRKNGWENRETKKKREMRGGKGSEGVTLFLATTLRGIIR